MDERLLLAQRRNVAPAELIVSRTPRMSTGPSPAPISTRPCATAREAASAAPRAASTRLSPRASSAVSVAECVQPAPCVAATSCRATGISTCSRAVEEMVDRLVAMTAGDDHCGRAELVQALGELAARAVAPGQRLRLEQVRRHDGREREERADERRRPRRLRAAVAPELATMHRVDDERHRVRAQDSRRRSRSGRARRAFPSSPRRRRCRRTRRRAARARRPAAARGSQSRRRCSGPSARRAPTCRTPRRPRTP